jgi:predicted O-methyltransferase YrrM
MPPVSHLYGNTIGGIIPYYYVAAITAALKPKTTFEIGTYLGLSALTVALNAPEDAIVYTVDLPDEFEQGDLRTLSQGDKRLVMDAAGKIGRALADHPAAAKVRQIRCNTMDLDVSKYTREIDFAFIDGGHSYELVKNDTEKCLPYLKQGGLMMWDDYRWNLPGVSRFLGDLRKLKPLWRIANTQYVVYSDRLAHL